MNCIGRSPARAGRVPPREPPRVPRESLRALPFMRCIGRSRPVDLCACYSLCVVSGVRRHARGACLPACPVNLFRVLFFMRCIGRSRPVNLCACYSLCVVSGVRRHARGACLPVCPVNLCARYSLCVVSGVRRHARGACLPACLPVRLPELVVRVSSWRECLLTDNSPFQPGAARARYKKQAINARKQMRDRKNIATCPLFSCHKKNPNQLPAIHQDALPAKAGSCARTPQKANDKRAETNA